MIESDSTIRWGAFVMRKRAFSYRTSIAAQAHPLHALRNGVGVFPTLSSRIRRPEHGMAREAHRFALGPRRNLDVHAQCTLMQSLCAALAELACYSMMVIMRYPDGHKDAVRQRIIDAAASALRAHGLAGVSIPGLMKSVGLTHGGFYAHFADRDALVAAAVEAAGAATSKGAFGATLTLEETLARYLSMGHVEHPEEGCVVAALGTDGARQAPGVRKAFADVARGLLRLVEHKLHRDRPARTLSDEALRVASTMVGAIVLARLVDDPKLADRILRAARERASA
jgi:TetR/AcrR family transcriptional regulator, transcriptional repressor for nem operon